MTPRQLAIETNPNASEDWIEGFCTLYDKVYSRQYRCKPVVVYQRGIKVTEEKSLLDASIYTGISKSRICVILKHGGKTRDGHTFKYGELKLKSQL